MANAERRPARQCPRGHTMDPNWDTCPYCEAEERAKQKTNRPELVASSGGRETKVGEVLEKVERRETKAMPSRGAPESAGYVGAGDTRRIVGVLITYTWRPEGELFPIREGKNFIGSGKVSSDASHRDCEVQVPQDARMSSEHALILCRHGQYEIIDQISSNGTFLGEEMLMSNQSTKLPDYAEIKTGDTSWTFIKIRPSQVSETPSPKPAPREEEKSKDDTIVR